MHFLNLGVKGLNDYTGLLVCTLQVVRDSPTGTYLDKAVFDKILKRHQKKPNDPREVSDWIRDDVHTFSSSKTCSGVTFESLVDLGILDEKKKFIGKKFPTLNAGKLN